VLVFERRHLVGGAAVTEELYPGFRYSTAAYLVSLMQERIVRDLELARHGYHVYPKEPAYFAPFPDGRHFFMWREMARTQAEIAKFSAATPSDTRPTRRFLDRLAAFVEPMLLEPPPNLPPRAAGDFLSLLKIVRRGAALGAAGRRRAGAAC